MRSHPRTELVPCGNRQALLYEIRRIDGDPQLKGKQWLCVRHMMETQGRGFVVTKVTDRPGEQLVQPGCEYHVRRALVQPYPYRK